MSDENQAYELVDAFEVDNGELNGIAPAEIFCLGVEWEQFRQKLLNKEPVDMPIHSFNAGRCLHLCERYGRRAVCEATEVVGWHRILVAEEVH